MKKLTIEQLVQKIRQELGIDSKSIRYCRKNNHLYFYTKVKIKIEHLKEVFVKLSKQYCIDKINICEYKVSLFISTVKSKITIAGKRLVKELVKLRDKQVVLVTTPKSESYASISQLTTKSLLHLDNLTGLFYKVVSISDNFVKLQGVEVQKIINVPIRYFQTNLVPALSV